MCHGSGHSEHKRKGTRILTQCAALFGVPGSTLIAIESNSLSESLDGLAPGGGIAMWVTIFAWWALLVGGLAMVTALVTRDQHWLVNVRRVTFTTATVCIAIFAFAGAYVPAEVAPLIPLVLVTLAFSVASILIVDMRSGRLTWRLSPHHLNEETLWRSILRALSDASTLDAMLLAAASALRRATRARMAVVYKTLESTRDVRLVGAAAPNRHATAMPLDQNDLARLSHRGMNDHRLAEYRRSGTDGVTDRTRWAVVPIRTEKRAYATILLADPRMNITDDRNAQTVTTVSRLLGFQVASWISASRATVQDDLLKRVLRLQRTLTSASNFGHGLAAVAATIRGVVPADYISLAWLDRARYHEDRVSTMLDDGSIIDQRRRWPIWESTTSSVLQLGRAMVTPDLDALPDDTPPARQYERQLGMRSRVVVPIHDDSRIIGALTLAHTTPNQYGADETRRLEMFTATIASWLGQLEHAHAEEEYRTAVDVAHRISGLTPDTTTDRELLETILNGVDATGLRLYRLDDTRRSLNLIASVGRVNDLPVARTSIPLSETPWHRWALQERTAHRIDQSDPERLMDHSEAATTMIDRMKTGWIVPIQSGSQILGFLDVMEARDPDRRAVRDPERLVLEAGARLLAQRWAAGAPPMAPDLTVTMHDLEHRVADLGGDIVNPITGIIGCVELIRQKQPSLSSETIKYLRMIENSATRIHETVADAVNVTRERSASSPPDAAVRAVSQRLFEALSVPSRDRVSGRYSGLEPVDVSAEDR
ncbi:MAG: hypothetical protein Kow0074_07310 [Candidatus Zixiibacteriota bacterium]